MPQIKIRRATVDDTPAIVRHRNLMFADMGSGTPESRAIADGHFDKWLRPRLASEEYIGWVACDGDEIVAGLGLWIMEWLPAPDGVTFVRPYVCNVYTENSHRKQGIAHEMVKVMLAYCRNCGYKKVLLHASIFGRPIYEELGFTQTNEMEFIFN